MRYLDALLVEQMAVVARDTAQFLRAVQRLLTEVAEKIASPVLRVVPAFDLNNAHSGSRKSVVLSGRSRRGLAGNTAHPPIPSPLFTRAARARRAHLGQTGTGSIG